LLVNLSAPSSLPVGNIDPLKTIEGVVTCLVSAPERWPEYNLYIEDELGREAKAER